MPRVIGQHDKYAGFSLVLDSQDAAGVAYDLPFVICHETANMARYQHGLQRGEIASDTPYTAFRLLITEGVAVSAAVQLIGRHKGLSNAEYEWYDTPEDMLQNSARKWVQDTSILADFSDVLVFMRGTPGYPRLGYKVGHYLICRVAERGFTLPELVRMPTAEYELIVRETLECPNGLE